MGKMKQLKYFQEIFWVYLLLKTNIIRDLTSFKFQMYPNVYKQLIKRLPVFHTKTAFCFIKMQK